MVVSAQPFDLITMGRIGVDLYPMQSSGALQQVESPERLLGGSVPNVALAAARLGRSSAVITRASGDSSAAYLHDTLTAGGVDSRWVSQGPDLGIHTDDLDYFAIRAARILWITGTGLSGEPCRSATLAALKARDRARTTVLDLDWHPRDPEEARPYYAEALRHATVAIGDLATCEAVTGVRGSRACAEALLAAGVEVAVVRLRPRGVCAAHRDGTVAEVAAVLSGGGDGSGAGGGFDGVDGHGTGDASGAVDAFGAGAGTSDVSGAAGGPGTGHALGEVAGPGGSGGSCSEVDGHGMSDPFGTADGLGAGDSFGGRFCHGLLSGWELERTVRYADAAGAGTDGAPSRAESEHPLNRARS